MDNRDPIKSFLNVYKNNPDPGYAILINGEWGVGKTHFIKEWIKDATKDNTESEEEIVLKPIVVSLYGLSTTAQITEAIDREVHPFIYGKLAKVGKTVLSVLSKVVFRADLLDVSGDGKADVTASGSIDILSLFSQKNDKIKGDRFIVFDDLERCSIPIAELLGYINFFVEKCGCKVVVIGNIEKIKEDDGTKIKEIKEKTFGREFMVTPNIDEALDSFIKEGTTHNAFLQSKKELIKEILLTTKSNNLRLLKQALYDFSVIEESCTKVTGKRKLEIYNKVVECYLKAFLIVFFEWRNADSEDLFREMGNPLSYIFNKNGNQVEKNKLIEKYKKISSGCVLNIWDSEIIKSIVDYLTTGGSFKEKMEESLKICNTKIPLTELSGFDKLDNEEFIKLYKELEKYISSQKEDTYAIGYILSYFFFFDEMGLCALNQDVVNKCRVKMLRQLKSQQDIRELWELFAGFQTGTKVAKGMASANYLFSEIEKCYKEKYSELKSKRPNLLESFNDEYLGNVVEACQDFSKNMFENVNLDKTVECYLSLSNGNKIEFTEFLCARYRYFELGQADYISILESEFPYLSELTVKLESRIADLELIERFNCNNTIVSIKKIIKSINGEGDDNL